MRIRVGVQTDIGRSRVRNEDAYLVNDPVFAVADGMGGHRGGDVASSLALESLRSAGEGSTAEDFQQLVEQIKSANHQVLERGEADRDLRGMGTTLTAILASDGRAHIAHVGDSRAYLLREGSLQQLTEDHTLVQRMVRQGRLTEEEAHIHPQRSVVTRALGLEENIPIDELTLDLKEDDRLLLCTDGLSSMLERDTIQEILQNEPDPQAACDRLVEEANRAGGEDNITVVLLDVVADDEASAVGVEAVQRSTGQTMTGGLDTPGDTAFVRSVPDDQEPAPRPRRRRLNRKRAAVWSGVVVVVILAGLIGTRYYLDRQWYVGNADGRVAIYNGIPATVLGFKLAHVQESTELPALDAERLAYWRSLEDGITAGSFEQAQGIVDRIRQDLQASATPQPGGS